jgi:hypothetical protein
MPLALRAFTLLALFVFAACQTAGVPAPKTYNERLASGYVTVTSVRDTARTLVLEGLITADDAQNVQNLADQARMGLDLARTFGQTPQGEDKLTTALIILTELQSYLAKRAPK